MAALLLAGLSLVFCALIIEAGLRASAARAALPAVAAERTGGWLADHSVFYQALRQRVSEQGALYQQVRQRLGHAVERVARPG